MKEICDFCKSPDPHWLYPCEGFIHTEGDITVVTTPDWGACGPCHSMIEREDRYGLALRAAVLTAEDRDSLVALHGVLERLFDTFWAHRTGEPSYE